MFDANHIMDAIDVVADWDLTGECFAVALIAQANLMAGIDPEQIIGLRFH